MYPYDACGSEVQLALVQAYVRVRHVGAQGVVGSVPWQLQWTGVLAEGGVGSVNTLPTASS